VPSSETVVITLIVTEETMMKRDLWLVIPLGFMGWSGLFTTFQDYK